MESLASLRGLLKLKRAFYQPDSYYYCILSDNTLSLYNPSDLQKINADGTTDSAKTPPPKPINSIHMSNIKYVHSVCTSKFLKMAGPRFQITLHRGKPLLFECNSSEDLEKWMCALQHKQPTLKLSINDFELLKVIGKGASGKVYLARKATKSQNSSVPEHPPVKPTSSSLYTSYSISEELPAAEDPQFNSAGSEAFETDRTESELLPTYFAIKAIRKDRLTEACTRTHVIAERNILMLASHQFITRLYYSFQSPCKLYFVLEYIAGGDLRHHLNNNVIFSDYQIRLFLAEIIIALRALHLYGIIYRDLKPENILIDLDGHIKLTDFGLAKMTTAENKRNTMCGTYEYLPPEMIQETTQPQTNAIDYWSLGVLAYRLIVNDLPFKNQNISKLFDAILNKEPRFQKSILQNQPKAVSFIRALLQKDPTKRLGSDNNDITQHEYFEGLDWNKVVRKQYEPDFKPYLPHPESVNNFDKIFTEEKPQESFIEIKDDDTESSFFEDDEIKKYNMCEYGCTSEESSSIEKIESLSGPSFPDNPPSTENTTKKFTFDNFSLNNENSPLLTSVVSFEDLTQTNTTD